MKTLHVAFKNKWFDHDFMNLLFNPINNGDIVKIIETENISLIGNNNEQIEIKSEKIDILDCLVELGVFSSKSQARKNWRGPIQIPEGFSHFERLGKHKNELVIWLPKE